MCQSQLCVVGQVSLGTKAGWSSPYPRGSGTTGVVRESAQNSCHPSGCQAGLTGLVGVPSFPTAPHKHQLSRERGILLLVPHPRLMFYSAPSDLKRSLIVSLTGLTLQWLSLAWWSRSFMVLTDFLFTSLKTCYSQSTKSSCHFIIPSMSGVSPQYLLHTLLTFPIESA